MTDFHQLTRRVSAFSGVRVLCLGDIMVDRYIYGRVSRISAEAPIPVMSQESEKVMLGAVGNVARNVVALGGQANIIAIVGDDDGGREVARLIAAEDDLDADLVTIPGRKTTYKTRYLAKGQQLLRADQEDTDPLDDYAVSQLIEAFRSALHDADIVVLSDYAKGCLGNAVLKSAIEAAKAAGKKVIADPKNDDLTRYDGVDVIKPNTLELQLATGFVSDDDQSVIDAAKFALDHSKINAILVTRSEQGMTLVQRDTDPEHFNVAGSEVYDVSGAGDTALSVLALALGAGSSLSEATDLANRACSIVVSKIGTAVVYTSELLQQIQDSEFENTEAKVNQEKAVADKIARWRAQGARIGFTNGCFDLIHAGHVSLLSQAREHCDRLIVALNTDASVQRLKGKDRPINHQTARAMVIASLAAVDTVVLFDDDTPLRLIEAFRPDVLIKGADYTEDQVVGADIVKAYGGKIVLAQLAPELSTTNTIEKIKG